MRNTWFSSDHHFHHKNILNFENRPYSDVASMNEGQITTWNEKVKLGDLVYYMGDMVFGGYEKWLDILPFLNGEIHLIVGNHDNMNAVRKMKLEGFIKEYYEVGLRLKVKKHEMWLSHYPLEIGLRPHKWSIHGHIHSEASTWNNQLNVGVDSVLLRDRAFGSPIHIDELLEIMDERTDEITAQFLTSRS